MEKLKEYLKNFNSSNIEYKEIANNILLLLNFYKNKTELRKELKMVVRYAIISRGEINLEKIKFEENIWKKQINQILNNKEIENDKIIK